VKSKKVHFFILFFYSVDNKNPWILEAMTKTILIVEDNDLNLKVFDDLLQAHGYHTLTNKDGINAVVIAEKYCPDLILMDIRLPKISGFKVLRMIKSLDKTRNIPIIAVTALAMEGDERKILAHGFDGYIAKPMSIILLLETIKHFLD
jgi:two-component system cell cycle response regulator DivK